MTARELIKALQDLGEENLDKEVEYYDEYRYVPIVSIRFLKDSGYNALTGNWENKTIIAID